MANTNANSDMLAKLKAVPSLAGLDLAILQQLTDGLRFIRVEANETVFRAREAAEFCYIISFGSFKLTRPSPSGKEIVMCFLRPGDFLGAGVMTNAAPQYPLTAVAIEDSGLIQIPRAKYLETWQQIPDLTRQVNVNVMGRLMEFQQDKALSAAPVAYRIANFLLRTLDAQPKHFGDTINLPLTRRDIAERVGTSVETVIRIMSGWSQKGWVVTEDQRITIVDRVALESAMKSDE
jgi:CRP-like cAMP-binding protein